MLEKKKSFLEENKYIFIAFAATALTMLAVYLCNGITPFGDKTILRMDLYHQYGPLFAELYDKIKEGGSIFYSWQTGLGSCFLGNYFNYLSSPLGAIVMFFGHKNIPEAIATMILIKAALSASTFTYYIKRSLKSQSYACVGFGVLYAFCAYMIAYYWNVMWIDAMVLLPVVLLGIERIINNGKPMTYIIGLALTMFSNYYMSYMLCVFSVIYFIHYYITNYKKGALISTNTSNKKLGFFTKKLNKRFLRAGFIFAFASLAAAGIMAFVLLPVYSVLQSSSATTDTFPEEVKSYFTFFDFFANHLGSLTTTIRSSGDDVIPNVYCGVLTIILAPLFFFTKTISKKEKLTTLSLLITLYFSFNYNFLNFIWHGFHFPNDLPYRQSFIYSFILLVMAYKVFIRLNEFTSRQIGTVGACLVFFVFLCEEITSKNVQSGAVLLTLALTVLYVLVLSVFRDERYHKASLAFLLLICICSEVVMCDAGRMSITITKESYASDYEDFRKLKSSLDTVEENEFYRMELADLRTRMDPAWYGYNGASVFSSMASESLSNLQDDLGMMSNRINSYTYNPQTPIYNMMFSLKYIVNNETPNILNSPFYSTSVKSEKFSAYENEYYLPIAYCIDNKALGWATEDYMNKWSSETDSDPFKLQGDYFRLATGVGNPFEKMEISYATYSNINPFSESLDGHRFSYTKTTADQDGSAVLYLTTEKKGNVYIYFDVTGADSKSLTINSTIGSITHSADQNCILDLGYYKENETIKITVPFEANSGTLKFFAYTINEDIFKQGYSVLADSQIITEEFTDTYIKGKLTAKDNCLLYTSIPYDEGWTIYIDGTEVSKLNYADGLIATNLSKGTHEIEFRFEAQGVNTGFIISLATILLIAVFYILNKKLSALKAKKNIFTFAGESKYYSEEILIPINKKAKRTDSPKYPISNSLPQKEIFYPVEKLPQKEVFSSDSFSTDIEEIDM